MAWVAQSGLTVPAPEASIDGSFLQVIDGVQIDVLNWLSGNTLDAVLPSMDLIDQVRIFHDLGCDMAKLHIVSDTWPGAASCARPSWDGEGMLGGNPLWDRFWENPGLSTKQRDLFCDFRAKAHGNLDAVAPSLDFGLIDADLVPANVMVQKDGLHFIDFDDGGFGFRQFDVATALLKHRPLPKFEALKTALLYGYHARRSLDTTVLDLFLALRAMTYVGWNIARAGEDQTDARNALFIMPAEDRAVSTSTFSYSTHRTLKLAHELPTLSILSIFDHHEAKRNVGHAIKYSLQRPLPRQYLQHSKKPAAFAK